eukprot:PITA_31491
MKHLQGKENKVADALSRKVQNLYEVSISGWKSPFLEIIKEIADQDTEYQQLKLQIQQFAREDNQQEYELDDAGRIYFKKRLYVPNQSRIRNLIMDEFHVSHYAGHPGYQKIITTIRKEYFWPRMKKNIVEYLPWCLECQQIKAEHQHPTRLLQPLPVPEWKWEIISMDFITGLPKTKKNNDSIFVVVDKLTFWKTLFAELGTQLNFSIAYHPQTDGQTERVNHMVEDMLRAYVMQQPTRWEDYLHLVEFAYNNGYHTSTQMSPFEVMYGQKCRTPTSWGGPEDKLSLGPEMLKEMEDMVKRVRVNLKVAQDRQKNFADRKRRFKEFQVGDHVYIRIQAKRSILQWNGCAKLAPRYCGPFQILAKVGPVAYQLALPSHIRIHNVFHVSVLKKYVYDPKHVIRWQEIQVQWRHFGPNEATWEDEELMRRTYPDLFGSVRHRDGVQSQGEEM